MTTTSKFTNIGLVIMASLAIITSIYPAIFAFVPESRGLFSSKPDSLIESTWYVPAFIVHIGFGAIAIFSGSTQFFEKLRKKRLHLHRLLGKIYVLAVIPSGITGLIVGFYATGNLMSKLGFIGLAIGWLVCTIIAFLVIKKGKVQQHQKWMMRSYAFCFAFVTFRIYLGLGTAMGMEFNDFYSYLSFLSWVPNLLFVEYRIKKLGL